MYTWDIYVVYHCSERKTVVDFMKDRLLGGSGSQSGCSELVADSVNISTTNTLQYPENNADRSRLRG